MAKKSTKEKKARKKVIPSSGSAYFQSLENYETIEYVRCNLVDAHILDIVIGRPADGWSATGFTEEIWQGNIKVVDRGRLSVILLIDKVSNAVTAVFPIVDLDSVERCVDSSRYFVIRVKNEEDGITKYIAVAFNERTSAFDFNVALETSRREKEGLLQPEEREVWDMEDLATDFTPKTKGHDEDRLKPNTSQKPSLQFTVPTFQFGKEPTTLKPPCNDTGVTTKRKRRSSWQKGSQETVEAFEPFVTDISSKVSFETFLPTIEPFADFSSQGDVAAATSQNEENYRCLFHGLICCTE